MLMAPTFQKQLGALDAIARTHLKTCLEIMSVDVFDPRLHTKALHGDRKGLFSFRIGRDYRAIFRITKANVVTLIHIAHRKDIYRF